MNENQKWDEDLNSEFCKALRESTQLAPWANTANVTNSTTFDNEDIHSQSQYFNEWEEDCQSLENDGDDLSLDTGSNLSINVYQVDNLTLSTREDDAQIKDDDDATTEVDYILDMSYTLFMSNDEEAEDCDVDDLSLNN